MGAVSFCETESNTTHRSHTSRSVQQTALGGVPGSSLVFHLGGMSVDHGRFERLSLHFSSSILQKLLAGTGLLSWTLFERRGV